MIIVSYLYETSFWVVGESFRHRLRPDRHFPLDNPIAFIKLQLEFESIISFNVHQRHGRSSISIAVSDTEVVFRRVLESRFHKIS